MSKCYRMKIFFGITLFATTVFSCYAQNLFQEKMRKIPGRKRGIYLVDGIFFKNGRSNGNATLKAVRHSYDKSKGFERIVFDLMGMAGKIYGHMNPYKKVLYIDFMATKVNPRIGSFGKSKFVNGLNIFSMDPETLSLEVELKDKLKYDVFFLTNPNRLVVDLKSR